jgi:4-hydroxy-tetrahydrodipicolinate synthase
MAKLSKIKNIVGVKEASGDLSQMSEVIEQCGPDFDVLSGDDALTLPLLSIGGKGVISVVANIIPADVKAMIDAFNKGDINKAKNLHHKMFSLVKSMFIETNPIPVKAAMALMGLITDEIRLPLTKISETNLQKLKEEMIKYGIKLEG